ncbi:MAG TPA: adenylate/guanylate cyclase domain-containing protein [Chthoniobacterales bacterium]|nr:adenylate/guanylate cyclase domain-containing protein [Chthoniobacterales bacterium]
MLATRGEPPMQIGIGINTGPTIVGSIESPERLEFTVLACAVNFASGSKR